MTESTPRQAAAEAVLSLYPERTRERNRSFAESVVAAIESAGVSFCHAPDVASGAGGVEVGQEWADPSTPGRIVRVVAVPVGPHDLGRSRVETVAVAGGGRTGQRTNVSTEAIPRRFRLVRNADGSEA